MIRAFSSFTSRVAALPVDDIDTDQIIPARFLKTTRRNGLGDHLFSDWRRDPGFALNRPDLATAMILATGNNFGCGSSREHAAWALVDWGFRAVVSTSFADIFRANALKNGLLPIQVSADDLDELLGSTDEATVDLETQVLMLPNGRAVVFSIEPFAKRCLLDGVDELGYLLSFEDAIAEYEGGKT